MQTAPLNVMDLVPTASAIAFAASVAPFTKMVPATSSMLRASSGFASMLCMRLANDSMEGSSRLDGQTG